MIKSIIFDFGDVFLTLDKTATQKHLKSQGIDELDQDDLRINQSYEKGLTSTQAFIKHYTQKFEGLSKEQFKEAWNSMLIDFPHHRLDFIKQLKESASYQLILLSNTNALHIDWVKEHISSFDEFEACFDKFYLSHEIHLRKPDREIFEFVINENNLTADHTLFVDDTLEHILSAKQLGIHTWHLQAGKEEVTELFSKKSDVF